MPESYRQLENTDDVAALRRGDRVFVDYQAWSLAGLLDPSGTAALGLADLYARGLEDEYLANGVRTIATVTEARFTGATTLEIHVVLAVTGFQDSTANVQLAAFPVAWALAAVAVVGLGWFAHEVRVAIEASPAAVSDVADTVALFPVALVLVGGFLLIYFLSRR